MRLAAIVLSGRSWHGFWILLTVAGGAAAAALGATRGFIDSDGIAYLDVADAYRAGGWAAGANGYWSPLYPWLLAGASAVLHPEPAGEIAIVHLVNAGVYLLTFITFILFWSEVRTHRKVAAGEDPAGGIAFGALLWWGAGYALFLWCSLRLIRVWAVTPDMLVMAAVLAAGTCLLRISRNPMAWGPPLLLGAVLGLGYLAKAVMFPLAFVFLGAAALAAPLRSGTLRRVGGSALVFALLAAPFVLTLSLEKGRFTFGDTGRLNYARYVNGLPDLHWQGGDGRNGTPVNPTRQISTDPPAFEFATPVGGTYPVWYDPSYWYEGARARFDLRQQVSALIRTGKVYVDLFLMRQGAALGAVILLLVAGGRPVRWGLAGLRERWFLWLPAFAGFALYALVYVEPRYVAPFLVLGWGALLSAVRLPPSELSSRLLRAGGLVLVATFLLNLVVPSERLLGRHLRPPNAPSYGEWYDAGDTGSRAQLPAARALAGLGVRQGEGVAFIGYSYYSYWARLAGLRIVSEIPLPGAAAFWSADMVRRNEMTGTLFATGACAIVIAADAGYPPPEGWIRLGNTGYYALLAPEDSPC